MPPLRVSNKGMYGSNEFEANSVEATFHEGLDLLEANHCEEALRSFDWVIQHSPHHADAHYYRGLALLSLQRGREAVSALRQAVELAPTESSYAMHLGYALLVTGRPNEAEAYLAHALEIEPYSAQARTYYAATLAALGKLEDARVEFETVLTQEPDNAEVRQHYAALLHKLGLEDEALEQCEVVLELQPFNVEALSLAATIAANRGDHPAAIRYLRQLTALTPTNVRAWLNLISHYEAIDRSDAVISLVTEAINEGVLDARLLLARGRHYMARRLLDKALTDFEAALELNSRLFEAHLYAAQALGALGRLRQALHHATLAVRLRSNDRTALLVKAEIHRLLGETAAENECLSIIIANSPRDFGLVQRKVQNLLSRGQYAEAFTTLDQYLHHRPRHRQAWMLYAEVAERMGNEGVAWRAYRRLLGLGKVPVTGYLAYAAFLVRRHQLALAADVLQTAAAHYPTEPTIQACRAAVLETLGRAEEAKHHLQRYLEVGSPNGEILWLLGRAHYLLGEYAEALEVFRQARTLHSDTHGSAAPTFQCLIAEAYTLHHLGRTAEGIRLLERCFSQYARHELEYFEALGELNEWAGNHGKALSLYAWGLEREPHHAALHYRMARVLARLHSWKAALDHLRQAIGADPNLASAAKSEKLFRPLWLVPSFHKLVRTAAPAAPPPHRLVLLLMSCIGLIAILMLLHALLFDSQ